MCIRDRHNFARLTIDLLTAHETNFPDHQQNAPLLALRLVNILDYLPDDGDTEGLHIGIYASDHATPAAIRAAAQRDTAVQAIVVNGGIIDHAGLHYLEALAAPLLVIVNPDENDVAVATQRAFQHIQPVHEMHQIETDAAASEAAAWFTRCLLYTSRCV